MIKDLIFAYAKKIFKIICFILSIFLFIWFFRWASWKGMISFVLGMGIMGFLLLSKNPMLRFLISFAQADDYFKEIIDKK